MTSENDDFVVICAAILDSITLMPLEQSDLDMLDPTFDASFNFSLTQDTALGMYIYISLASQQQSFFHCVQRELTTSIYFHLAPSPQLIQGNVSMLILMMTIYLSK